ncbi:MAG: NADH-quinone oxidoreductase subunit L, partial [Anaerolineae bacterium]
RAEKKLWEHAHEAPAVMSVPMLILAVLAVVGGYIGLPRLSLVEGYLEPVLPAEHAAAAGAAEWVLLVVSAVIALGGIALAYYLYVVRPAVPANLSKQFAPLYTLLSHKYYVDEFYMAVVVEPLRRVGRFIAELFDPQVVDGVVNGLARLAGVSGEGLGALQSGRVRSYALSILVGVVIILGYFLLR